MPDLRFFGIDSKIDLDQVAALTSTRLLTPERKGSGFIEACAPLSFVGDGRGKAAFFSDRRYLDSLKATTAEFVFVAEAFADAVPSTSVALIGPAPQAAWSRLAARLHPPRLHEGGQAVHPSAKLEDGVSLGVGVVIGQGAESAPERASKPMPSSGQAAALAAIAALARIRQSIAPLSVTGSCWRPECALASRALA